MDNELYILIDSSGYLYKSYYNPAKKTTPTQVSIGDKTLSFTGIEGYLHFTRQMMQEYDLVPSSNIVHIVDSGVSSLSRREIYPEYKAHRSETPEDLVQQRALLPAVLRYLGYKAISLDGVESDDIIGTYATLLSKQGKKVMIITQDKDLYQLLDHNIIIVTKKTQVIKEADKTYRLNQWESFTENYVYQKYGFPPSSIVDFIAIWGDTADNIPGVLGIGEKGAKELISSFHTVENLLNNLDKIRPVLRNKIEKNIDNMLLSKKLALIDVNVSLPDIESLPVTNDNEMLNKNIGYLLAQLNLEE